MQITPPKVGRNSLNPRGLNLDPFFTPISADIDNIYTSGRPEEPVSIDYQAIDNQYGHIADDRVMEYIDSDLSLPEGLASVVSIRATFTSKTASEYKHATDCLSAQQLYLPVTTPLLSQKANDHQKSVCIIL